MQNNRRKKRIISLMVGLMILIIIVAGLLIAALIESALNKDEVVTFDLLVRSETVYIILILAILLLVTVIVMAGVVKKRNAEDGTLPWDLYEKVTSAVMERELVERERLEKELKAAAKGDKILVSAAPTMSDPASASEVEEKQAEDEKEEKKKKKNPRFYMLSQTDAEMKKWKSPSYNNEIGFEELCVRFRSYCASRLHLYYDIADIRRFIAGLTVTHLMVMQGMSGTGKTSLAYAFGEFLQNHTVIVPIQPMWKERTDMIGYYNEFTKRFNETVFLQKMYEANYNDEMYVTVLDEMNIARVEYYFAEFLSLLEIPDPNKRYLDVVSDKWENDPKGLKDGRLRLPTNMWFMGTVNNDDSTFAISDKVYDRAMVMNLDSKAESFEAEDAEPIKISASYWSKLTEEAREDYCLTERNKRRIAKLDEYLIENFRITFGNRIMKQITGYVPVCIACGGKELDAIDDILSKKVLRKLESQNPVYVKSMAEGLCNYLDDLFGMDKMPLCKEYLRRLERNA